jgi:hypothetical protein
LFDLKLEISNIKHELQDFGDDYVKMAEEFQDFVDDSIAAANTLDEEISEEVDVEELNEQVEEELDEEVKVETENKFPEAFRFLPIFVRLDISVNLFLKDHKNSQSRYCLQGRDTFCQDFLLPCLSLTKPEKYKFGKWSQLLNNFLSGLMY